MPIILKGSQALHGFIFRLYPQKSHVWPASQKLFQRSWFSRIWVLQEVAVARGATVVCGRHTFSLSIFPQIDWYVRCDFGSFLGSNWARLWVVEECRTPESLPVHLFNTLENRSSEPRDKIFALLGLVKIKERFSSTFPFTVDYKISVDRLFRDVTKWCILRDPTMLP